MLSYFVFKCTANNIISRHIFKFKVNLFLFCQQHWGRKQSFFIIYNLDIFCIGFTVRILKKTLRRIEPFSMVDYMMWPCAIPSIQVKVKLSGAELFPVVPGLVLSQEGLRSEEPPPSPPPPGSYIQYTTYFLQFSASSLCFSRRREDPPWFVLYREKEREKNRLGF